MAQHPTNEPQTDPLDPEGTDARWEPLPDEEWAALTASLEPASDTEASRRVDEWLEPAATVVRRASVEAARPAVPACVNAASARGRLKKQDFCHGRLLREAGCGKGLLLCLPPGNTL